MEKLNCRNVEKQVTQEAESTGKLVALVFTAVFNKDRCQSCLDDIKSIEKNLSDKVIFCDYDCSSDYYRMDKYNLINLPMIFVFNKNGIVKSFEPYDASTTQKILENILK